MPGDPFPPLSYTEVELESYIPSGWSLSADEPARWDPGESAFRATVLDGSDLDWELVVPLAESERHGRIEALRRAVDELDRKRFESFL
jgi:hypothetical protein